MLLALVSSRPQDFDYDEGRHDNHEKGIGVNHCCCLFKIWPEWITYSNFTYIGDISMHRLLKLIRPFYNIDKI